MIEFEVMIGPIKALAAPGEQIGNRIGPQLAQSKPARPSGADFGHFRWQSRPFARLRARGPCGKDRRAL